MTKHDGESSSGEESVSVFDSDEENVGSSSDDDSEDDNSSEDGSSSEFEEQSSVSSTELVDDDDSSCSSEVKILDIEYDLAPRKWAKNTTKRQANTETNTSTYIHTDNVSSDEESVSDNRIGKIPLHWYDEFEHLGYDVHGKKISKATLESDNVDRALQDAEDKRTDTMRVYDALNGKEVVLSQRQLELIRRVQSGAFAHPEFDAHPDYIDYFSGVDLEVSGLNSQRHPPKSRFQPSKYEALLVRRLLHKLKSGSITLDYLTGKLSTTKSKNKDTPFLLWTPNDDTDDLNDSNKPIHIPPPKQTPPTHAHSYNPPAEYLPTPEELQQWQDLDPQDRPYKLFTPQKFQSLRQVPAYPHAVQETFQRCLDLYLCPRLLKRRLNIDPHTLLPSLPKPNDLRPFPTLNTTQYLLPTPENKIRDISISPDGQFLAAATDSGQLHLFQLSSARLLTSYDLAHLITTTKTSSLETTEKLPITSIAFNPNPAHHTLLAAISNYAVVISTGTANANDTHIHRTFIQSALHTKNTHLNAKASKAVTWIPLDTDHKPISAYGSPSGPICLLETAHEITELRWHRKGDYFVTVSPKAGAAAVLIHQLSKANSQQPFQKNKGEPQCVCFHPTKPFLFVATQQNIRVYHLIKQTMVKRLTSGCRWISSMDVHPTGDHVIAGSLDRRLVWFDLDLSNTPYRTLKYHERALRKVAFHPRYPLMASSSDDGTIHVFHTTVYSDLMRNPLIVPVKVLRGHDVVDKLGVLSFAFHPTQPWLVSAGADGKIYLFQDI